ncbi:hypothetical protein [Mycobacteroides abscessus]|uniref:hypothetical protein n=1 Tax=Mycobacteroides abscessus TaxID=36809 RepID=UPI0012FFF770|nr:hypothetical protein [Mycobacteroides abscessus]
MSDEPSDAQKFMRDVMRRHRIGWYGNHDNGAWPAPALVSSIGMKLTPTLPSRVDKALGGLTMETEDGMDDSYKIIPMHRFVSGWTVTE